MSAALFDLDRFGQLNETYGSLVGDRVLYQFGQLLKRLAGKADLPSRFAGQRFLLMTLDTGPRAAVKNAEFVRQSLAKMIFLSGAEETEVRLTACGGYTEIKPDDTVESMIERLETALQAAKKAGPDRACFHNGREPEPVNSPNLGARPYEVRI
jgi:diguanylate cyclase (GGDEF)-like protein